MQTPKKHLLMLSASYAHIDPRILWMADSFAKQYEVTILAHDARHNEETLNETFFSLEDIYSKHNVITCGVGKKSLNEKNIFFLDELRSADTKKSNLCLLIQSHLDRIAPAPIIAPPPTVITISPEHYKINKIKAWLGQFPRLKLVLKYSRLLLLKLISRLKAVLKLLLLSFKKNPKPVVELSKITAYVLTHFINSYDALVSEALKIDKPIDVIYVADLDTLLCSVALKKLISCQVVYDAHEIYWASRGENDKEFESTMKLYEGALLPSINQFITVSPMIHDYYKKEYPFLKNKSMWVPNACPIFYSPERPTKKEGPLVFLFQGNISPERGLDFFIRAWKKLATTDAVLFLRGPGSPAEIDRLKMIAGSCLNQSVFFKDIVAEHELITAAMEADVGIIPYPPTTLNQKYCSPNKLSQYMQAGLVILASNTEFVSHVLAESNAGLVYNALDIDDLVKKLHYLIQNPELIKNHQFKAKEYAETKFNWNAYETELLSFIS